MQKLSAFYLANSKNELPYFSTNKTVENLHEILYNTSLYDEEDLEEELTNKDTQDIFIFLEKEILKIEKLLNLDTTDFTDSLGEIIADTFNLSEEEIEDIIVQDDNSIEEDQDSERKVDAILDNK